MPASSSPYTELSGRRAFVTGGAKGIGRAIAHALAQSGVKVAIADIDADAAQRAAKEIGTGAVAIAIDVRERASVERAFDEALKLLGGCDICIANAGVSTMQRALDLTDAEWDFNFAVNARGIFLANQIAARHFVAQGSGCIVNTASLAAKVGAPLLAHYSASKFAVLGWTQALARELAPNWHSRERGAPASLRLACSRAKSNGSRACAMYQRSRSSTTICRRRRSDGSRSRKMCSDKARFMTGQGINVTGGVYMT
jgi:meso-butanediol dehydrogenase / (S,S)-butanediol dehydrogenase / diacetyl reductase